MSDEIPVALYLFSRLRQLGIKSVFSVPGDYELALLDFVPEAGLKRRGNPNELNAGYAADGYARVNGVGAVVTTLFQAFGPLYETRRYLIKTPEELDNLLTNKEFCAATYAQMVELILPRDDAPLCVKTISGAVGKFNTRKNE